MIFLLIGGTLSAAVMLISQFFTSLAGPGLSSRIVISSQTQDLKISILERLRRAIYRMFEPKKKLQRTLFELPDFLDLLAAALASGDGVYSALKRVVPRLNGLLGDELTTTLRALEFGSSLEFELTQLSKRLPQQQLMETCNKLTLAIRRGTPLWRILVEQAEAVRQEINNQLIKQAGRNETRMLIPLVFLILPVTVLFAIYPSLELLNITYL